MLEPSVRSTQEKEGRYFSATLRLGCYSILTTEPTAHSLPFYKRVPRDKCLQITALAQATTNGGGYHVPVGGRTRASLGHGKWLDPSHSLRFQLPPCFLVLCFSKKLFMCTLTSAARPLLRWAQRA